MKQPQFLRQRYKTILSYIGFICLAVGILILSSLAILFVYPMEIVYALDFLLPGLGLGLGGLLLWQLLKESNADTLTLQEGAVIVVLSWLVAIVISAIPLATAGELNFTQAIFESTSCWTTTGLSVIAVSQTSHLVIFYRSIIQLAGGAGLAIITLSALTGPFGSGLTVAEGRSEQLEPNIGRSAKIVLSIYAGYVVFGILALRVAGMDWFDAINHAFATLSTGGISTRAASIGYWDSPAIEAVTIMLMLLGSLNFLTSYTLLQGRFLAIIRNSEIRLQVLLIPICALILLFGVTAGLYPTQEKAVRVAIFETISAMTTTGYSTVGYGDWQGLGLLVMIVLMLIGGGTGSASGGIKQYRIYVLCRGLLWEVRRLLLPQSVVTEPDIWQGEYREFLSDRRISQVSLFVFLYLMVYAIGTGIIAAYGYSLPASLFEFASALSTVGLSVGVTTADAPSGLLWVETVAMFLGRFEFFTVFVGTIKFLTDTSTIVKAPIKNILKI